MAGGTHLRVLSLEPCSVEPGSMRVESSPAPGRMTGQAIAFGVTADAGFETLPSCLAVTREEELLGVMKAGPEGPLGNQPGLLVTGRAEGGRAMTISARGLSRIGCRRMTGEETGRMIASHRRGGWTVAVEALGPGVAGSAGGGGSGGQ